MSETYGEFKRRSSEITHLRSILQSLSWDQETMMPEMGAGHRALQVSTLAVIQHQRLTDPAYGDLIARLEAAPGTLDQWGKASVREARRQYDKATRLPESLVKELAETAALAYEAWVKARSESDFPAFAPWLDKMVKLKRAEAQCLQIPGAPLYEALLDDYEPGAKVSQLDALFTEIRPELTSLLDRITSASRQPRPLPTGPFPVQGQETLGREILTSMGFNWKAGRVDTSPHPFCSGFSPLDVRITTRYSTSEIGKALFGMMHECGHALYEQGLNPDAYGLPACDAVSLGIHESQSRLWENQVGRSRGFWEHWFPRLRRTFPPHFDNFSLDDFVFAINKVIASPVRVEADEVTYGLHVILRYELEKALIAGELEPSGLDEVWNERMQEYLRYRPANAAEGVLQDTHWSQGLLGYFPTYLLGNLYAAQLFEQARRSIPELETMISTGELLPLREWLRTNVHARGKALTADELIQEVTGRKLSAEFFLNYLKTKFGELYFS
ncbi:MAG: carboxypeptidase M32 [Acidobacteriota bacterium]